MERKELSKRIELCESSMRLLALKDEIVKALGSSSLAKKLSKINSAIDFYSHKTEILGELSKKKPVKEVE